LIVNGSENLSPAGTLVLSLALNLNLKPRWVMPDTHCQIEFVASDSDIGTPKCGQPAVTECADCGVAVCSACHVECCEDSFCEVCHDYHVTHSCVRQPVQKVTTLHTRFHHRG
jgi:hypothetical protein